MDSQIRVGMVLDGRYRLDRLLGEGGMGVVYRAYHLSMERDVAVKVLRGHLANDSVASRRFALEAKATTKVDSPYAVKVFDFGITAEGEYFMVMEYLDGRTAQRELDVDGPMPPPRAMHVAEQALAALATAHAVGVIHRDIKPENLLLMRMGDDPDACKVLDFGVAKLMASAGGDHPSSSLTKEGMVFGTPEFMSPEQACGQMLDGRSDVYSLAATLFTLLTGRALFLGGTAVEVLSQHVLKPAPRLTEQRGLHHLHALDQVLQRGLAKRPGDRYRTAAEFAQALAFLAPSTTVRGGAAPTVPIGMLGQNITPVSPLGVVESATGANRPAPDGAATSAPAGSAPRVDADARFSPGRTGYLPRLSAELSPSTQALVRAMSPRSRWRAWAVTLGAIALALATWKVTRSPTAAPVTLGIAHDAGESRGPDADSVPIATPTAPTATPDARIVSPPPSVDAARTHVEAEAVARRLQQHLAAARAARAEGNFLRQLAQADLAPGSSPGTPCFPKATCRAAASIWRDCSDFPRQSLAPPLPNVHEMPVRTQCVPFTRQNPANKARGSESVPSG
jgi:eukaryotic-like serine/threonine-protein kinase